MCGGGHQCGWHVYAYIIFNFIFPAIIFFFFVRAVFGIREIDKNVKKILPKFDLALNYMKSTSPEANDEGQSEFRKNHEKEKEDSEWIYGKNQKTHISGLR
nr:MAG: hypothetical protein [Porcellio scaber clopovirus]